MKFFSALGFAGLTLLSVVACKPVEQAPAEQAPAAVAEKAELTISKDVVIANLEKDDFVAKFAGIEKLDSKVFQALDFDVKALDDVPADKLLASAKASAQPAKDETQGDFEKKFGAFVKDELAKFPTLEQPAKQDGQTEEDSKKEFEANKAALEQFGRYLVLAAADAEITATLKAIDEHKAAVDDDAKKNTLVAAIEKLNTVADLKISNDLSKVDDIKKSIETEKAKNDLAFAEVKKAITEAKSKDADYFVKLHKTYHLAKQQQINKLIADLKAGKTIATNADKSCCTLRRGLFIGGGIFVFVLVVVIAVACYRRYKSQSESSKL